MYFLSVIFVFLVGTVLAAASAIGEKVGWIRVHGWNNFPHNTGGIELVSSHPSLIDWLIVIPLFRKGYIRHPIKLGPSTFAEVGNYRGFFYKLCKLKIIYVDRSGKQEVQEANEKSLAQGTETLAHGGNIIIFGGGGREGSVKTGHLESLRGKKIRPCKRGAAQMAVDAGATVLCTWLEIEWLFGLQVTKTVWLGIPKVIWITIGEPFIAKNQTIGEVRSRINKTQLKLADATNPAN